MPIKGRGLGIKFLKHIERTRFFVHLVDASGFSGRDPLQDFDDINNELKQYDLDHKNEEGFFELSTRPQIVALNKADTVSDEDFNDLQLKFKKRKINTVKLSGVTGLGVKNLIDDMTRILQ